MLQRKGGGSENIAKKQFTKRSAVRIHLCYYIAHTHTPAHCGLPAAPLPDQAPYYMRLIHRQCGAQRMRAGASASLALGTLCLTGRFFSAALPRRRRRTGGWGNVMSTALRASEQHIQHTAGGRKAAVAIVAAAAAATPTPPPCFIIAEQSTQQRTHARTLPDIRTHTHTKGKLALAPHRS